SGSAAHDSPVPIGPRYGPSRVGRWSSEVLLQKDRQRGQHSSPVLLGGTEPSASWRHSGAGSTKSRQTDTAANALEIDVPSRHEHNVRAGPVDSHVTIVPRMLTGHASRSNLGSR